MRQAIAWVPMTIEQLCLAFVAHPLKAQIQACPCGCIAPEERLVLAEVGLRELSCEQLSRYAFKAMTTWGDGTDYRHFLPRILELAATDEGPEWPGLDLGVILAGCSRRGSRRSRVGVQQPVQHPPERRHQLLGIQRGRLSVNEPP